MVGQTFHNEPVAVCPAENAASASSAELLDTHTPPTNREHGASQTHTELLPTVAVAVPARLLNIDSSCIQVQQCTASYGNNDVCATTTVTMWKKNRLTAELIDACHTIKARFQCGGTYSLALQYSCTSLVKVEGMMK